MIFEETELKGAYLIKPEKHLDERGFFTRTFCKKEFEQHGLNSQVAQCNTSYNKVKGTFRGMHYQAAPHAENKMVSCGRGAIWDVIVDLRTDSPSYRKWIGVELSEENRTILYVPEGFAHGFLTLHDHTTVLYQMTEFYHPESACGFRWDDSQFGITLPQEIVRIADKDMDYQDFAAK